MNRRNVMLAASGAVAATIVGALPRRGFGQTAAAAVPQLTPVQYRRMTLSAGTFSKQASQIALAQAVDPRVRQFAQFEFAEQTAMAQVLTDLSDPPPASLDASHANMLQSLAAVRGKAFDVAFVEGQVAGHQELLDIQQGYLNLPPTDRDLEHIAVLARTAITMHLTMLADLRTQLSA